MSETANVKMPLCNWCGKIIAPGERAIKFPCPGCGEVVIWRCEKCRLFGRSYKCPKCGIKGP
ncbi:MAG: zinc finger domain-containing protein [Candidatus Bathyarchaeota archaeon]|nr:zinc finger domain-containing protein [Candidatus Bathyarchaeota archaeon]